MTDDDPYYSALDLSKPLPPRWRFAASEQRAPIGGAAIIAILLAALALARSFASDKVVGGIRSRWLKFSHSSGHARLTRLLPSAVALVACVAIVLWPVRHAQDTGWPVAVAEAVGVAAFVLLTLRVRAREAQRAGIVTRVGTWPPAVVFGAGATVFGVPWSPMPVVDGTAPERRVHWVPVAALGVLAGALLLLALLSGSPLSRTLGAAALGMTAALLTPIPPFDGAVVAHGRAGTFAAFALLAAGIAMLLGFL